MFEAKRVVKAGAVCRVENRTTINIIEDPWRPDKKNMFIRTENEGLRGIMVSALFDLDENMWDIDLIKDMFDDRDANLIISIPPNRYVSDGWF